MRPTYGLRKLNSDKRTAYPKSIVPLSYRLHAELAKEHGGEERWGFRRIHCGQLVAKGRLRSKMKSEASKEVENVSLEKRSNEKKGFLRAAGIPKDLDWFSPDSVRSYDEMGDPDTTAQVHPEQFTTSMAALAEEAGAKIILGSVTDIESSSGSASSITYTDKETGQSHSLPATDVIVSAGPWTKSVFPKAPIDALRAHSVTIRPARPVSAYAIFTEIQLPADPAKGTHAEGVSPEIYARPNNEIYACGEGDTLVPLPATTADVETDPGRCQDIIDHVSSISDELKDGEVLVRQACYLPNVPGRSRDGTGGPLVGFTGTKGLYLASGHTCWGIQNGPGTGKLMSEYVFDGEAKSANVKDLDPRLWL